MAEKKLFYDSDYDYDSTIERASYVYVLGGKKCSFFGKFDVLSFLETPVLRFALLPYYWRIEELVKEYRPQYWTLWHPEDYPSQEL